MEVHDWSDVPGRVAALARHPGAASVFGAAGHRWDLAAPLSGDDLADLESGLGVRLPSEYRSFLAQAGGGGAGPAYGLFPVHRADGGWRWEGDGAELTDLASLTLPFPHVDAFNPGNDLPDPPDEADYDTIEAFNEAENAYWDEYDDVVFRPEHSVGLLYLCHLGCAYREGLVVSGPARGQMWADDTAGDAGFRPLLDDDGTRMGFARWYRRWLDGAEAHVRQP